MTDTTNPRAALDAALEAMRSLNGRAVHSAVTAAMATAACAEALSLLVDAQLTAAPEPEPEPDPEPDPRESLPDDTLVGHGWVMGRGVLGLLKPYGNGRFTWWFGAGRGWGAEGWWRDSELRNPRPATVGDLRRVGLPVTEWPDIEPPASEPAEPPEWSVVLVNGNAYQQLGDGDWFGTVDEYAPVTWDGLLALGTPTVIHAPKETP